MWLHLVVLLIYLLGAKVHRIHFLSFCWATGSIPLSQVGSNLVPCDDSVDDLVTPAPCNADEALSEIIIAKCKSTSTWSPPRQAFALSQMGRTEEARALLAPCLTAAAAPAAELLWKGSKLWQPEGNEGQDTDEMLLEGKKSL
jgi:hypothetical protein